MIKPKARGWRDGAKKEKDSQTWINCGDCEVGDGGQEGIEGINGNEETQ